MQKTLLIAASLMAIGTAPAAAQQEEAEPDPRQASYASGLLAEVYVVSRVGETKIADLPDNPAGVPIGVIEDKDAPVLEYSVFEHDEKIASYHGQNILGILWSGFLDIRESGTHIVSISDYRETPWGVGEEGCVVRAWLNESDALSLRHESHGESKQNYTDQQAFELSPGLYELAVWKACSNESGAVLQPSTLAKSRLTLLMKSPSQRKIEPVDPVLLVHDAE